MNGWIQFIFHSDVCYVSVLVDSRSLRYVNYIKPIPLSMQRTGPPQYNIWSPIGCSGFKTGSHAPFHPTPKLSALRLSLKPGWFVVRASSKPWAAFGLILNNVNINLLECINRISGLSAVPKAGGYAVGSKLSAWIPSYDTSSKEAMYIHNLQILIQSRLYAWNRP